MNIAGRKKSVEFTQCPTQDAFQRFYTGEADDGSVKAMWSSVDGQYAVILQYRTPNGYYVDMQSVVELSEHEFSFVVCECGDDGAAAFVIREFMDIVSIYNGKPDQAWTHVHNMIKAAGKNLDVKGNLVHMGPWISLAGFQAYKDKRRSEDGTD